MRPVASSLVAFVLSGAFATILYAAQTTYEYAECKLTSCQNNIIVLFTFEEEGAPSDGCDLNGNACAGTGSCKGCKGGAGNGDICNPAAKCDTCTVDPQLGKIGCGTEWTYPCNNMGNFPDCCNKGAMGTDTQQLCEFTKCL